PLLERKGVLLSPDPSASRSWAGALLELGISQYRRFGADSPTQGPLYLRKSEAEIGMPAQAVFSMYAYIAYLAMNQSSNRDRIVLTAA
ncbi:MAG: hypothetical protein R6V06_01295, partial [Kiritimatiellia bacterium]